MDVRRTAIQSPTAALGLSVFAALPILLVAGYIEDLEPGEGPAIWMVFIGMAAIVAVTAGAHWTSGLHVRGGVCDCRLSRLHNPQATANSSR